jgi:hypothetical protein
MNGMATKTLRDEETIFLMMNATNTFYAKKINSTEDETASVAAYHRKQSALVYCESTCPFYFTGSTSSSVPAFWPNRSERYSKPVTWGGGCGPAISTLIGTLYAWLLVRGIRTMAIFLPLSRIRILLCQFPVCTAWTNRASSSDVILQPAT